MRVTTEHLEKFVVNCQPDLDIIKTSLSAFNIFNVLGIQYREIRHSNFLGWLFDPNESHQLGDIFLKDLFKLLNIKNVLTKDTLGQLLLKDFTDTKVYRESVKNIDILILNEELGFVITIENKIHADFAEHQLAKYYNYIEKRYEHVAHRIYLTLTPKPSYRHNIFLEGNNYSNINYQQITDLIDSNFEVIKTATPTVSASINQYVSMVRKNLTMTSDEVLKAREIYRLYKNEIDFIIQNQLDFSIFKDEIIGFIKAENLDGFSMSHAPHINVIHLLPDNQKLKKLFHYPDAMSWNGEYIFSLILFFEQNNVWLKFGFGNIIQSDTREKIVKTKSNLYGNMFDFEVFKKTFEEKYHFQMHPFNPTKEYTGVTGIRLFDDEEFHLSGLPFKDFFIEKFDSMNAMLIKPWINECLQKLI